MSQRLSRVAELIFRELAAILVRDFDFGGTLVSIRSVEITPDLRHANIYISTLGAQGNETSIVEKLQASRAALQQKLCKRVILKFTPQLHFKHDDSIKRGTEVVSLIDGIEIPDELKPIGENDVEI
jgi:ribosome-binding factor A